MDLELRSKLILYSGIMEILLEAENTREFLNIVKQHCDTPARLKCDIDGFYTEYLVGPLRIQKLDSAPNTYNIFLSGDKMGEINER